MKLQRRSQQQHQQLKSQKTGEDYSLSNVISDALHSDDIFLSHEIIRPNSRSSAPHYHTDTNEIIYVLNGTLKAVEGNEEILVEQGDSIMFERQSGLHHFLRNDSTWEAHVLVIRRKMTASDVVF
ncbi:cupin domain-containing protein [Bdellovibrio sp. KM01]|uniref:cupin domain-containing protein n=1 Tax=Bdellovibrio sp. KM01 TaxID=2748865 RepID=UPI0015EACAD9|nr:cupin domain-containing protein [Bdellovibrio sp. KM01]QLY26080.1 cupin domain-containing protein [Bdellovibrio sp. KM01]